MKAKTYEFDLDGRKLKLEMGYLAQQADASVLATWGETVVLATVATKPTKEDMGYFPLSVEYVERYYAGGIITNQKFIKRETRPTDVAILAGRAIDRSIRPLFPKDFHNEVQIILTVLSYDGVNDPVTLGFIATSAALSISSVPFDGPIGVTTVGGKDGTLIFNPTIDELETLDFETLVAVTSTKVAMVETEAKQSDDKDIFEAIKEGFAHAQLQIKFIEGIAKEIGKNKLTYIPVSEKIEEKLLAEVKADAKQMISAALADSDHPWHEATGDLIKDELAKKYVENVESQDISAIFDKVAKELMNSLVLSDGKRVDSRGMEEVRPLDIKIGLLPRTHGSAVFQRGTTQVLSITTLGPVSNSQTLEGMTGESTKRFMHHYNMSSNPFSVGDVKRLGSPNRRDVGHGALVEKGLLGVMPELAEFPYAMRTVSEVMAANASTSMASVCASTLSLLNAGVPLKAPVAGIAMGLLSSDSKFQVITDMQAVEDFYGEMDFKITGTEEGITAIQMDTKLKGLSFEIIEEAIKQGKKARVAILSQMNAVISKPAQMSQYAPKIVMTKIDPSSIGQLIGPGGKNINALIARNGAQIDIEDDGTVMVSSVDAQAIQKTIEEIDGMFKTVAIDEEYDGKVVKLMPFGAFVEILPGKEGLVHVSQMAPGRVESPEEIVSVGQPVKVRVIDVTPEGKINLSMLFGNDRKPDTEKRPQRGGGDRGGNRRDFGRRPKRF